MLKLGPIKTLSLSPPNSNMVFLSRFKSHRPENLTAFLPQQLTLVLTPGVRPARSHHGHTRGFKMGIY